MTSEERHDYKRTGKGPRRNGPPRDGPRDDRQGDRRNGGQRGGFRKKPYGDRPNRGGDRKDRPFNRERGPRREGSDRPLRERSDRPRRDHSDRPRREFDRKRDYDHKREFRPREERSEERPKLVIPDDPQKLLFKGVDFQAKADDDKALVMFLHGSVLMSKGCENLASKIISSVDDGALGEMRTRISEFCSDDALVEFDYLCQINKKSTDRSFLDTKFSEKNIHAIYRRICLEEIEGEDEIIDTFARSNDDKKVIDGLKFLVKKKDSKKAESFLGSIDEKKERKQYVHTAFVRAMKGDAKSKHDLEKLSKEFPEAAFFLGYVKAREEDNAIPWLKEKFPQFQDLIISEEFNLRIGDTSYGMYLRAMKIKSKKEDWIPSMIKAAKYGSEEAMEELRPLMRRTDIKKAVANIHLNNSDLPGLIDDYVNGLDETYYLDKYCESNPEKIVEMGRKIGDISPERGIDWLRAHAPIPECREALTTLVDDERYHSRKLLYALHDVGKNMEAADLYFNMEGHPDLPAVKWLAKVCRDEDAKEYIRSHYESIGDTETFDYIFVDDGYKKKPKNFRKRSKF